MATVLLLSLALVKGGGVLWLHELFHTSVSEKQTNTPQHHCLGDEHQHIQSACDCFGEFSLPVENTPALIFTVIALTLFSGYFSRLISRVIRLPFLFRGLRAPPFYAFS